MHTLHKKHIKSLIIFTILKKKKHAVANNWFGRLRIWIYVLYIYCHVLTEMQVNIFYCPAEGGFYSSPEKYERKTWICALAAGYLKSWAGNSHVVPNPGPVVAKCAIASSHTQSQGICLFQVCSKSGARWYPTELVHHPIKLTFLYNLVQVSNPP